MVSVETFVIKLVKVPSLEIAVRLALAEGTFPATPMICNGAVGVLVPIPA